MQDNEHKKKRKAGLHKEISSIFDGVPVPGRQERPSGAAAPERAEQGPARPIAPGSGVPQTTPTEKHSLPKGPVAKAAAVKTTGESRWQKTWQKIKNKLFTPKSGARSTRQKVMLILVPILFIALIYVLMPLFRRPNVSEPKAGEPTKVAVGSKGEIVWQIPEPYPTTLRDPMQPSLATAVAGTGTLENGRTLIVKGIVHSKDNPAAVIGTQIVHEGDAIAGASVTKINQDSVEFEMNDKRWTQKVQR